MSFKKHIYNSVDTIRLAGLVCLFVMLITPGIASVNYNLDSLFADADQLKIALDRAGDTSTAERLAFREELTRVIELASRQDALTYTKALVRCERMLKDLSRSYEFLSLIRSSAERWESTARSITERCEVLLALGKVNASLQDHKSAYLYLDKLSSLPFDSLSGVQLSSYYFLRGYLAYFAGEYKKSVSFFIPASSNSLQSDDKRIQLFSHNGLAHVLNLTGDYKEGYRVATKALSLFEAPIDSMKWSPILASLYMNLAEAQHGLGEKGAAYQNISNALRMAKDSRYEQVIGNAYWIWSRILRRDGRFEESKLKAEKALERYTIKDDLHYYILGLDELVKTAKAMNDYQAAMAYSDRYHYLKDSLNSLRLYIESRSAEYIRKSENQQAELALLKEERARRDAEELRQKIERLGLVVLVFILGLGVFLFYWRFREKKNLQEKLQLEVKRRTEALKLQAERLKVSNEELERFAYIASHDLKTPIRNVVSFLGLIERKLPRGHDASLSDFIRIASDNARHMHSLITGVLEFSRLNSNPEGTCESFELGEEVKRLESKLPSDGVEILIKGTARINAPKLMVLQVVQNLIENGIKYNEADVAQINVAIEELDGITTCRVSDNGIGIEPEYTDKIFEMFKRLHTSDQYEGTGLGLALCKKITTSIGGEIAVESVKGEGSVFTVKLPSDCAVNIDDYKVRRKRLVSLN